MKVNHILKPIYNENSKILILGTMPSPKSREVGFYYGHPQNRFWKVLSDILNENFPNTKEEKVGLLLKNNIAIWDVLESCEIEGASDSTIKNPRPNNLNEIVNGKKAESLYKKLCEKDTMIPCMYLPSTSPANCAMNYQILKEKYTIINEYLKK